LDDEVKLRLNIEIQGMGIKVSEKIQNLKQEKSTTYSAISNQDKFLKKNQKFLRSPPLMQTKLTINQPGDEYEKEADRVAEQVMRMPEPTLQRKCTKCEEEDSKILQTKEAPGQGLKSQNQGISPIVDEVLQSPGKPLDSASRAFMEPRFGHDFSRVRVHSDTRAAESARVVNALAYTVGHHVVFGAGQHMPWSETGRKLLAHELTHVVQQAQSSKLQPQSGINSPGYASKRIGDTVATIPSINPTKVQISRKNGIFEDSLSTSGKPRDMGSTLPYREATELVKCVQIMGEENAAYCRQTVLGEKPTTPVPSQPSGGTPSGAASSGSGKTGRVLGLERSRKCAYTVTYANQKEVDCVTAWKALKGTDPPGPLCGTSLVYDIVSVSASGSGCPKKLEGLRVSENTKGDHGCTPPNFTWPSGSCVIGPGGKVSGCTDTFTLCGLTSALKGDCTEFVDQEIEVGGELAEEHEIKFELKKDSKGCKGTVVRN
jgi:hypothetical protein